MVLLYITWKLMLFYVMLIFSEATDRRWSVICTDQIPRFGTHAIRGLTVKFNHHRVKVILCSCFVLPIYPFKPFYTIQAEENVCTVFFTAAVHTRSEHTQRERERETRFRLRDSHRFIPLTSVWMETYTQVMFKYPFWQVFWYVFLWLSG